jgi:hypothetical protein
MSFRPANRFAMARRASILTNAGAAVSGQVTVRRPPYARCSMATPTPTGSEAAMTIVVTIQAVESIAVDPKASGMPLGCRREAPGLQQVSAVLTINSLAIASPALDGSVVPGTARRRFRHGDGTGESRRRPRRLAAPCLLFARTSCRLIRNALGSREGGRIVQRHLVSMIGTLAIAVLLRASTAVAAEQKSGTADGTLTVAGKTTPLEYAYARAGKGFFDKTKEDVLVILSDVPIPDAALDDEFARHKMAADGKLHAVEVTLNSEKEPISGGLLHEAFASTQGYVSVAGMHRFEPTAFDGKIVAGKLWMEQPNEFMDKKFQYAATFRAEVWRKPPPTFSGAAAAQSAPGKATIAFLEAAHAGNVAKLKKIVSGEIAQGLAGPQSKDLLEMLKTMTPDPIRGKIESIDVHGDQAEAVVVEESKDGSVTSTIRLTREDGAWKVTGM